MLIHFEFDIESQRNWLIENPSLLGILEMVVFRDRLFPSGTNVCFDVFRWSSPSACLPICFFFVVFVCFLAKKKSSKTLFYLMHSAYVDIKKGRVIFIFFAEFVCYSGLLFPSKKRYVKNTVVFAQGDDPNDGFYLVLSGTLKVEVNDKFVRTLGAFCYLLFLSLTCINFPLRSIYFIPSKY